MIERNLIEAKYTWAIDEMYPSIEALESDYREVDERLAAFDLLRGTAAQGVESLLAALELRDSLWRISGRIYTWSRMKKDEDNRISERQGLFDRAEALSVKVDSAVSWLVPELLAADEAEMRALTRDPRLAHHRFNLEELLRQKAHILSEAEERILALGGEVAAAPRNIFSMINNADLQFGTILDEDGKPVELTKGSYVRFMESPVRSVRKEAFEKLYAGYRSLKNTIGTTLLSAYKKDSFHARVRKYDSVLHMALDDDFVPTSVYDNLIGSVREALPMMERYVALRKRMLNLDEVHFYDLYAPLVADANRRIPYEEAVAMVLDGLKPLGEAYGAILRQGFEDRWIDVEETPGKTGGAYSWGTYDSKPYVLLNYQENLNYVFTIAHEMGHSLHSWHSKKNQPYSTADYKIFVAEVASTVNEAILMQSLLAKDISKNERLFLLNHFMEQFKGTVFRQTMFAEFEKTIHGRIDAGEALTNEEIGQYYADLNRDYYGPGIVLDEDIRYEWMRIPHFYTPFYVYKYATGFSAAMAISQRILREGEPAVADYLKFLSSGGSDHPIELLKIAGVDMSSPEPVREGLKVFEAILDQVEALVRE